MPAAGRAVWPLMGAEVPSSQRAGVGGELLMGRRPRPRPHPPRPALPLPRGIGALTRTSEAVPKLVTPYYTL
eukprot:scaffold4840_cov115-Isochrysis_galbana.AAC.1